MKKSLNTILKIIIPLGIGVYLTWFFISRLTDQELENLKDAFLKANYWYLVLGMLFMLFSHMSRAYRWKYMLQPLGYQPTFAKLFHSVMIGYLINLTIPRSGEIARAGYYAKYEKKAKFNNVFGTIIVERVIDLIMLGIIMLITLYLQKDIETFNAISETSNTEKPNNNWIYYTILGVVFIAIILFFSVKKLKEKVLGLIKGIFEGVKTILKLKQRVPYILHTLFIWISYIICIWICTFALPQTSFLSINAIFAAFVAGGIAISATPGGIGLYPIMITAVLHELYGVENAQSFSMLAWTALTSFTIIVGLISLFSLPFLKIEDE